MLNEQEGFSLGYGIVNAHQCNRRRVPIKDRAEGCERRKRWLEQERR